MSIQNDGNVPIDTKEKIRAIRWFDAKRYLKDHRLLREVIQDDSKALTFFFVTKCPFDRSHTDHAAMIQQVTDGRIIFHCSHCGKVDRTLSEVTLAISGQEPLDDYWSVRPAHAATLSPSLAPEDSNGVSPKTVTDNSTSQSGEKKNVVETFGPAVSVISKELRRPDGQKKFLERFLKKRIRIEGEIAADFSNGDAKYSAKSRAEALRSWRRSFLETFTKLEQEYEADLNLKAKGSIYPLRWMENDKLIKEKLDKYPISEALNCIDRLALKYSDPQRIQLAGGQDYENPKSKKHYEYSVFITNDAFYSEMTKTLNRSKNYVWRLITALTRIGALRFVRRIGNSRIYADGYFLPRTITEKRTGLQINVAKKTRFLTEKLKPELRNFKLWE